MTTKYPSDVKVLVEIEFLDGEKREYGISADSPSIIAHFTREAAKTGFIQLWNKRDNYMIPTTSIRSLSAKYYKPEHEPKEDTPKKRKSRAAKEDPRQEKMSY